MTKVVKFPKTMPAKLGLRKVGKKKKVNLEDYGQLNLFDERSAEARVVKLNSSYSLFEEALTLDDQGDVRSRDLYVKAIESGDCVADAFCNLGILESNEGNIARAIDCLTNCLRHDPRHFEAHYNLANIYADAGDLKLAKLHYEIAIQIEPNFPNSYYNLGLTLALDHQYDEAVMALTRYQDMAPFDEKAHLDDLIKSLKRSISKR